MTDLSKKLEKFISESQKSLYDRNIVLPAKTDDGILVGDILIKSRGSFKSIYTENYLLFDEISLNAAAIKIATLMALKKDRQLAEKIYRLDQEFSKWFIDSKHFLEQYNKSLRNKDFDRSEILWIRYEDSKERAQIAKQKVESLC